MNVTASGITRWLACPPSSFLSTVNSSNEWSERGTAGHGYIESVTCGASPDVAIKSVPEDHVPMCRAIDMDGILAGLTGTVPEVAWALDVMTRECREIGRGIGRKYGKLGQYELPGSCDLVAIRARDGKLIVRDYKFGHNDGPRSHQNMLFASVYILGGADSVISQICSVEAEGDRMGSFTIEEAEIGPFDVESYLEEWRAGALRAEADERRFIETGQVSVCRGDWCDWCGARTAGSCPAFAGLARTMVTDLGDIAARVSAMTPEQKGSAWTKMKDCANLLEVIESALKGGCDEDHPIPISDGKEVRPQMQSKTSMSSKALLDLAMRLGASAEDINRCFKKTHFPVYKIRNKRETL